MSDAPRVVLACDFFRRYTSHLAEAMAQADARVAFVTRDHALEYGGDHAAMRADVADRLSGVAEQVHFLPGRVRDPSGLAAAHAVRRQLGAFAPQVVHLQDRTANDPRLLYAARARPGRWALTVHDPDPHPGDLPRGRVEAALDGALISRAGLVFVHAERLRDALVARAAPAAPIEVVPHGVDAPDVRPLPDGPSLLFFGRISRYKGLDVLLEAIQKVWLRVPATRLVVAGQGRLPEHPALADPRVEVRHEHVPDAEVPALFAAATAVVLPYVEASQSGVGSQAKQYGRASVVTRLGGLPELVADGSGLVVEPGDPAALAGALCELLEHPERAAAMGARGAEGLTDGAAWPRVAELTLAAYRRARLV